MVDSFAVAVHIGLDPSVAAAHTDLDSSAAAAHTDSDSSVAAAMHTDSDSSVAAAHTDLDSSVAAAHTDLDSSVAAAHIGLDPSAAAAHTDSDSSAVAVVNIDLRFDYNYSDHSLLIPQLLIIFLFQIYPTGVIFIVRLSQPSSDFAPKTLFEKASVRTVFFSLLQMSVISYSSALKNLSSCTILSPM